MTVSAPKTVFSTGEQAKFCVTYNNESNYDVKHTKIELIRIDESRVYSDTDKKEHQMKSAYFEGAHRNSKKIIEVYFTVPQLTPSSDQICQVVNIFYEIHVTAILDGALDHAMKIPVFIIAN
jgi:hypothetical protein